VGVSSECELSNVEKISGDFFEKKNSAKFPNIMMLKVPWSSEIAYETKVEQFFGYVVDLVDLLQYDVELRVFGYVLCLVCFLRIIAYLRCHPRVAVLYKTIETASDDLFHFFVVFMLLYMVLAFIGNFGPEAVATLKEFRQNLYIGFLRRKF
jgi:hypothetical protein